MSKVQLIVGTQWGDEGKGKIVDMLANDADLIVRAQGGNNAGHTIVNNNEKYVFHIIPSGVLYKGKLNIIANGVVLDPRQLVKEIQELKERGIELDNNLIISDKAHVIIPYHNVLDGAQEESKKDNKIGTTKRGIGPCYSDKAARTGIRMVDLINEQKLREKLSQEIDSKNRLLKEIYGIEGIDKETIINEYVEYGKMLKPYVKETVKVINDAIDCGQNVLLEGAQGTFLDIDHGTYPFVTSSNTISSGLLTGSGIGPTKVTSVLGIVKAYTTRVGEGPFLAEQLNEIGEELVQKGFEFGATTGRKRRCGWLDLALLRQSAKINGLTEIALTKIDVLNEFEKIMVCVDYKLNGEIIDYYPTDLEVMAKCEPVYVEFEGWMQDINKCKTYEELPLNAKKYVEFIEKELNTKISIISTGPDRKETMFR